MQIAYVRDFDIDAVHGGILDVLVIFSSAHFGGLSGLVSVALFALADSVRLIFSVRLF